MPASRVRDTSTGSRDRPPVICGRVGRPSQVELRGNLIRIGCSGLAGIQGVGVDNGTAIIYMCRGYTCAGCVGAIIRHSGRLLHRDRDGHSRDRRGVTICDNLFHVIGF